jgi:hypothetical protein
MQDFASPTGGWRGPDALTIDGNAGRMKARLEMGRGE